MIASQNIDVSGMFIGIGGMVFFFALSYIVYQWSRYLKSNVDKESKFELFEELVLDKVAGKKGINLMKAAIERRITETSKSFRKRIEEEMVKEMFEDGKNEAKAQDNNKGNKEIRKLSK
jgi:transcriptional regulator CtsR